MDKPNKHPYFRRYGLLQAFGPDDLSRMQRIFDHLCMEEALNSFTQTECDALAKAVVKAYQPTISDDLIRTIALFNYDGELSEMSIAAWEGMKAEGIKR
jgi:hypothetical protein